MNYKEKTNSCSGCQHDDSLEHRLFHESGLSQGIIKKLHLTSLDEIKDAFKSSSFLSDCFISLNGRRTKVKEQNDYLMPKELIDLIEI